MSTPRISVVTICYNSEANLRETLESVKTQTYDDFEYIVVDGGSSDNTINIIEEYNGAIDRFVSERDDGIADAMNKGIDLSSGDYIFFLHSDDCFLDNRALERAARHLGNEEILFFDIMFGSWDNFERQKPRGFGVTANFKTPVWHQGLLCARSLLNRLGGFDTSYRVAMDFDFFLRAMRAGVTTRYVDEVAVAMRDTGISSQRDWPSLSKRFAEERRLQLAHCRGPLMRAVYGVYWPLYFAYRRSRSVVGV